MNPRLKEIMYNISQMESIEEIERKSRIQPRGEFSLRAENDTTSKSQINKYNKKADSDNQVEPSSSDNNESPAVSDTEDHGGTNDSKVSKSYKQTTLF